MRRGGMGLERPQCSSGEQPSMSPESASTMEGSSELSCLQRHNVRILGKGSKLLFLSHGFGTNQQIWEGVLKCLDLESTYRVILWDVMGAFSTNPDNFDFQRYSSLYAHADDLLEVLEELEVESLVYIGHSVGGMIGLLASIECPSFFERLILLSPSCRYLNELESGYHGGFDVSGLDQLFAAMQSNYTAWVSGFAPTVMGDVIDAPLVREFSRTLFLVRPDIAFHSLKVIFSSDFRAVLPKVQSEVHIISSRDDHAVPLEAINFMGANLRQACVQVLPLAGHLPHLTHPQMVAEALEKHILM